MPLRQIETLVHDEIDIGRDLGATIKRFYTFSNTSQDEYVSLERVRKEILPGDCSNVRVTSPIDNGFVTVFEPLVQGDGTLVHPWTVGPVELPPDGKFVVEIRFERKSLLIVSPPIKGYMEYVPTEVTLYTAELKSTFPTLINELILDIEPQQAYGAGQRLFIKSHGLLSVSTRRVSSNSPLRMTFRLEPEKRETLPLLKYLMKKYPDAHLFESHVFLIIPHVLNDFLSLLDALEHSGLNREFTFIIGIPYSCKEHVVVRLLDRGYTKIRTPSDYPIPFMDDVREFLGAALDLCEKHGKKLIVVEDGGYAIPMLYREFPDKTRLTVGGVEQTANGIWRYQDIPLSDVSLPTINVAECDLKKVRESPLIGQAVVKNINSLLERRGLWVAGKEVLLVGYGSTGQCIADSLKGDGARVTVFDTNTDRRVLAKEKGFAIGDSLAPLVRGKAIIVGATGKNSLFVEEILSFENHTVLVNASSKNLEISHEDLSRATSEQTAESGYGTHYTLMNGNTITLLANGFPINFFNAESVPDKEIQFIVALLYEATKLLVQQSHPPGLVPVPREIQDEVQHVHNGLVSRIS